MHVQPTPTGSNIQQLSEDVLSLRKANDAEGGMVPTTLFTTDLSFGEHWLP